MTYSKYSAKYNEVIEHEMLTDLAVFWIKDWNDIYYTVPMHHNILLICNYSFIIFINLIFNNIPCVTTILGTVTGSVTFACIYKSANPDNLFCNVLLRLLSLLT